MKTDWSHLDKFRVLHDPKFRSPMGATYGAFSFVLKGVQLNVIATDGRMDSENKLPDTQWEHVSVHAVDLTFQKRRIPKWEEMCHIKELFWDDTECVVQFHPAKADYVNFHDCVLHLWRYKAGPFPMPPKICV